MAYSLPATIMWSCTFSCAQIEIQAQDTLRDRGAKMRQQCIPLSHTLTGNKRNLQSNLQEMQSKV